MQEHPVLIRISIAVASGVDDIAEHLLVKISVVIDLRIYRFLDILIRFGLRLQPNARLLDSGHLRASQQLFAVPQGVTDELNYRLEILATLKEGATI